MNTELAWFKSSYSGGQDESCIEISAYPHTAHIRDSKDTSLPSLAVSPDSWASFLAYAQGAPEAG
ncbi:DUF397 domain-containing protein [Streptomyces sp. Isolate_219]|uniref:DUF397 domain-containing protein n=1 Tax=Streptomyces sp. Isolate_219 TaxID=2950110 RepID=UPI0021C5EA6A|nr:DUF397 domain-containing protein [Streptomyces sp. Isolate_219]MCR8576655.1 DUF397 domain-containing protein [Streptomyces sp. Isolate_219]